MADRAEKVRTAINWEKGVEQFGGDEEMFTGMVGKFESLTFNEGLKKMYEAVLSKEWKEVRHQAHTLKGASAYLAATGVQELSLQLQFRCDAFFKKQDDGVVVTQLELENFENEIVEMFLSLLQESKYLKERISEVTKERCDLSQIIIYETDIKRKYITNPPPPQCGCCKIF